MRKSSIVSIFMLALQANLAAAAATNTLVVHEWGTFTSLQGSDGRVLEGLQHEEENLPAFVHGRDPLHEYRLAHGPTPGPTYTPTPPCRGKCMEFQTQGTGRLAVTQKMETPVIYFYSEGPVRATVDVRFPQGIISQYYPAPVEFAPAIGSVTSLSGGFVRFKVDVSPRLAKAFELPYVNPSNVYAPSRNVNSNQLQSGNEREKLIFYRGVGNFTTPFRVSSYQGAMTITNQGSPDVADAFLVYVAGHGSAIMPLGAISGSKELSAAEIEGFKSRLIPDAAFRVRAENLLTAALVKSGLYRDESRAMTDTWSKSYFNMPGLRVLYILPRSETDRILPISIQPEPRSLVRTLVGRVEVLLDTEEQSLLREIGQRCGANERNPLNTARFGRYAEATLRRLYQISRSPEVDTCILNLLAQFN